MPSFWTIFLNSKVHALNHYAISLLPMGNSGKINCELELKVDLEIELLNWHDRVIIKLSVRSFKVKAFLSVYCRELSNVLLWLVNNFPWADIKIFECRNQVFCSPLLKSGIMGMPKKVCWMISQINKKVLILGSLQFKHEFIHSIQKHRQLLFDRHKARHQ